MCELHPAEDLLVDHVAGRLARYLRPLVEAHLDLCPSCRDLVAGMSVPGGSVLCALPGVPPAVGLWLRLEARLDEQPPARGLPAEMPLPPAARAELPCCVESRWGGFFTRGAEFFVLERDPARDSVVGLAHMRGGRVFPRHAHTGFEHSVVLSGGYADETGQYEPGDFGVYPPGSAHGPNTLEGEDCWILFCVEHPVRFAGWRGVLQRLFGS